MVGDVDTQEFELAALPKKSWSVRGTPGFQIHCAGAINPNMMPIVTTIFVTSDVWRIPRMMKT